MTTDLPPLSSRPAYLPTARFDWDKLRTFFLVSEAGSFSRAVEGMNISQSAISRQINTLEKEVGIPLFYRHARGLKLTEEGEILHRTVKEIFEKLAMIENTLQDTKTIPQGALKITASTPFSAFWLAQRLSKFTDTYSHIQLTIIAADRVLDLSMREADVAIRTVPSTDPDLIQRHILSYRLKIYASQSYLDKYGTPKTADELDRHRIITFGNDVSLPVTAINWLLGAGVTTSTLRTPFLAFNNIAGIIQAVRSGLGISTIDDYIAQQYDDLVEVLPQIEKPIIKGYFVYPHHLQHSRKIGALRDFLLSEIKNTSLDL